MESTEDLTIERLDLLRSYRWHSAAPGRHCPFEVTHQSDIVKFVCFERNGGFGAANRSLIGHYLPVAKLKFPP